MVLSIGRQRVGQETKGVGFGQSLVRRGANQFPPGSPIPTGSTVITIAPDSVAGSNIAVQQLNGWANSPTKTEWQWFFNGAPSGARLTTAPTGLSSVTAGSWKLVSYAENASNPGNPNYANSNTITVAAVDTAPDAFTFTDVTGATPSTIYESNAITVSGINRPAAISVTGGAYSVNGGAYTTAAGNVSAGDTVRPRGTSSSSGSTAVNVTVTIGGVSDTYTITTSAAQATKPAAMAAPSLTSTMNSIAVTRAAAPADGGSPITGYDLQYRTGAGAWTVVAMATNPQTISGLAASTTYEVQTRAVNAVAPADWSPSASIATQAAATAPGQMAAPTLAPGNTSIAVTRASDPSNGGSAITGYDLRYGTDGTNWTTVAMTTNPQTISGLTNGTAYQVQTRAVNAVGAGAFSPSATATPAAAGVSPFVDEFDGDGSLSARPGWTFVAGQDTATTSNGNVNFPSSVESAWQAPDMGSANHAVEGTIALVGTNGPVTCCRVGDINNWVGIRNSASVYSMLKKVGGTVTVLGNLPGTPAVGDLMRLEAAGDAMTGKINGVATTYNLAAGELAGMQRAGLVARTAARSPYISRFKSEPL